VIKGDQYWFTVRVLKPPAGAKEGTKLARGANFRCLLSGSPIEPKYIKAEGMAGRIALLYRSWNFQTYELCNL